MQKGCTAFLQHFRPTSRFLQRYPAPTLHPTRHLPASTRKTPTMTASRQNDSDHHPPHSWSRSTMLDPHMSSRAQARLLPSSTLRISSFHLVSQAKQAHLATRAKASLDQDETAIEGIRDPLSLAWKKLERLASMLLTFPSVHPSPSLHQRRAKQSANQQVKRPATMSESREAWKGLQMQQPTQAELSLPMLPEHRLPHHRDTVHALSLPPAKAQQVGCAPFPQSQVRQLRQGHLRSRLLPSVLTSMCRLAEKVATIPRSCLRV